MKVFDLEKELENKDVKELYYSLYRSNGKDFYFSKSLKKIETYSKDRIMELISYDFPNFFDDKGDFKLDKRFFAVATANNSFEMISYRTDLFQDKDIKTEIEGKKLIITKNSFDFSCNERHLTLDNDTINDLIQKHTLSNEIKELIKKRIIKNLPFTYSALEHLPSLLKTYHPKMNEKDIEKNVSSFNNFNDDIKQCLISNLSISKAVLNQITLENNAKHTKLNEKEQNNVANNALNNDINVNNALNNAINEYKLSVMNEIITEYKTHFPQLNEVLEWIVACRFTYNRRPSFLHLRANAGFGKSFFKNLFSYINLCTECRYDDFKSPSSLDISAFNDKLVMIIDEFTIFKKEFKDLTNTMLIDAKYQLRQEAEVFAKILLSAEKSNSFENGADKQIKDRMNVIDINADKLENLPCFQKYGSGVYMENVSYYIYHKIRELFDRYLMNGRNDSTKEAETVLKTFHNTYPLDTPDLELVIKKHVCLTVSHILNENSMFLNKNEIDIRNKIVKISDGYCIKQPKTTLEMIIKLSDENFYKKSRFKSEDIERILGCDIKNKKIDGKTFLVMFIPNMMMEEFE